MTTESISLFTSILWASIILTVGTLLAALGRKWFRITEQKQQVQLHMLEVELRQKELAIHAERSGVEKVEKPVASEQVAGLDSGGYIIFNMPDSKKGLFHDLLKGFEDYAKLRGYIISFSIDNSFPNKVAFKFTLDSAGINVSTNQVRRDLQEYIKKVQTGDSLDDLPVVLSPEEHRMVLTCMKNRINFLQHSYNLEKNATDFYKGLLKQIPSLSLGISSPQNFYLQSGAANQASSYLALNSPQAAQGVGNRLIENSLDQGIHIANSFNERTEQVEALSGFWMALHHEREKAEGEAKEKLCEAIDYVRKAEEELKEQDPPEPKRIHKWLETAKYSIKALGLTKEVADAAKAVWDAFGMSS
jgi:hypothetical protein